MAEFDGMYRDVVREVSRCTYIYLLTVTWCVIDVVYSYVRFLAVRAVYAQLNGLVPVFWFRVDKII